MALNEIWLERREEVLRWPDDKKAALLEALLQERGLWPATVSFNDGEVLKGYMPYPAVPLQGEDE